MKTIKEVAQQLSKITDSTTKKMYLEFLGNQLSTDDEVTLLSLTIRELYHAYYSQYIDLTLQKAMAIIGPGEEVLPETYAEDISNWYAWISELEDQFSTNKII